MEFVVNGCDLSCKYMLWRRELICPIFINLLVVAK